MSTVINRIKVSAFGVGSVLSNSKAGELGKKAAFKVGGVASKFGSIAVNGGHWVVDHVPEKVKTPVTKFTGSATRRVVHLAKNTQVFVAGGLAAVKDSKNPQPTKVVIKTVVNSNRRSSRKSKK